ncbi:MULTISPECIES: hypothetical protein [Burkholderia]|uniref:hypothetical protein n=1 Tax=Burkholderia TaxID=32008 RepID=UPI00265FA4B5|nr:hypothetical protein [Burkholderia sp. AU44665]MCA8241217.1 hypothetical protein [Burkholderia sp. AU32262]MDN7702237.1 hypothetical protein [Burkholderia sp. AU44665]
MSILTNVSAVAFYSVGVAKVDEFKFECFIQRSFGSTELTERQVRLRRFLPHIQYEGRNEVRSCA